MTNLMEKQLLIMGVMVYCGLAAGLVDHTVFLFRKRFIKRRWISGIVQVLGLVLIGWCIGKFLYYSSYGKITFLGVVCFFIGLWLWRKFLCKDTEDGETQWQRKETDCGHLKKTTGCWIFPVRRKNGRKREKRKKKKR